MSNESNTNDSAQGEGTRRLMMEAMIGEMRRMMRTEMEQIHARLDRVENAQPEHQPRVPNVVRRGRAQPRRLKRSLMTSRSMATKMKTIEGLGKILGDLVATEGLEISKMET